YFSSIPDFLDSRPYSFIRQAGDGRAVYWKADLAGFLQDDIRLRDNLSIGLGLRYEHHTYPSDRDNVAPRFSIAYAPGAKRATVIRAGAGVFYDRISSSAPRDVRLFDGQRLRRVVMSDPGYPNALAGGGIEQQPSSVVRLHPSLGTPRLLNYSLGVERRLWRKTTVSIGYRAIRGFGMFRSRDINAPLPAVFARPDPAVGILRQIESNARMESHALEVSLRGSLSRLFQGTVIYTLGRSYSDTGGISSMPPNPFDLSGEWARADRDRLHRFRALGSIRPGKLFQLGIVFSAYSGHPYSLRTGRDDNRDGRATDRPFGIARNSETGPGSVNLDVRLSREFPLRFHKQSENHPTLRLAVDAFNLLNHVNPTGVVGNLSSPFFGQPTSARSPRRMQLSLRLKF
ncbi:MAG: TonB-dependent receptor, partial [bacterium]|nr:TonB-dependent receptor [bacterium]